MKKLFLIILISLLIIQFALSADDFKLWYKQPAEKWSDEALPIGNGRLGAMLLGGVEKERIQFNEQSLWSGDNNWDGAYETGDHGFGEIGRASCRERV